MDNMLSQDEINALLSGGNTDETEAVEETLTEAEKDAVGEVSNISMGTAATTLFALLNQKVNITTPTVSYATWDDLLISYEKPCVFIQIYYTEGLDGNNILILKEKDVKIITDLMMGGDGSNFDGELGELHLSAISEAMNQMMGSASTSLSSMLEKKIDISPPTASLIDLAEIMDGGDIAQFLRGRFVKVAFHMVIGDLIDSELMQLYSFEFARDLYKHFALPYEEEQAVPVAPVSQPTKEPVQTPPPAVQPVASQAQPDMQGMPMQGMPYPGMPYPGMPYLPMQQMPYAMQQDVNIAPVQFQPFVPNPSPLLQKENMDLLLDVPLEVTAELGKTSKSIKEILEFAPGTIIELNRLAGEPIDVIVNGKYIAKGEVVVIEEAFGIRVTEIVK